MSDTPLPPSPKQETANNQPAQPLLKIVIALLAIIGVLVAVILVLLLLRPGQTTNQTVDRVVTATGNTLVAIAPVQTTPTLPTLDLPLATGIASATLPTLDLPLATGIASPTLRLTPQASNLPLPKASTATPLAAKQVTIEIDNDQATNDAQQYAPHGDININNLAVVFTGDHLELTGQIAAGSSLLPVSAVAGTLKVIAKPKVEHEDLLFVVTSMTINDNELSDRRYISLIERVINTAFLHQLAGLRIESATISEGKLTIVALEDQ